MRFLPTLQMILLAIAVTGLMACSGKVNETALRAEVGSAPVILLSTAWCGYCKKLRSSLHEWGVVFEEIDVETNANGQRAYELLSGRGVPILLVGDRQLHGYSPVRSRELLAEAGLMPAGASN